MSMVANVDNKNVPVLTFFLQYMDLWLLYMCDFYIYMMHWIVWWMCVND